MATRRLAFDNEGDDKIEDEDEDDNDDDLLRVNPRALMIFIWHDDFDYALLPRKTLRKIQA